MNEIGPAAALAFKYFRQRNINFIVSLPERKPVQNFLFNSNALFLFSPNDYEEQKMFDRQHTGLQRFSNDDEQHRMCDQIVEHVMRNMNVTSRESLNALEWSINEVMDNVTTHAVSPIGGLIAVSIYRERNVCSFSVVDAGVGICRSLRQTFHHLVDDSSALDRAIREGVTGKAETNQGNGLYGTIQLALKTSGSALIWSNQASLILKKPAYSSSALPTIQIQRQSIPLSGTLVSCDINLSNPDALRDALCFRGRPHYPQGMLDRFEDSERVVLKMLESVQGFGTRRAAEPLRVQIENIIENTSCVVQCDFDGVAIVTSSFADEVFGKIVKRFGVLILHRVQILRANTDVKALVERAISLRMLEAK